MKKIRSLFFPVILLTFVFLSSFDFAPKPETVCFYFNPSDDPYYCPNAAGAVLKC